MNFFLLSSTHKIGKPHIRRINSFFFFFIIKFLIHSLLSFSFANEINTVEEAKTYYPAFGLVANVALIFSGQYVKVVSMIRASLAPGVDAWGYSLKLLMAAIVVGGGAILGQ